MDLDFLVVVKHVDANQTEKILQKIKDVFPEKIQNADNIMSVSLNGVKENKKKKGGTTGEEYGITGKTKDLKKGKTLKSLSPKENSIMELLATGMDTHRAAKELFISYKTIRKHIQNIYVKLEVNSRISSIILWKEINKK